MEATLAKDFIELNFTSKKETSPSGAACTFIQINDEWGIKTYRSENLRDECYKIQSEASEYDLAPPTGNSFNCIAGYKLYCYTTRVVEMLFTEEYNRLREYCEANSWRRGPEYDAFYVEYDRLEEEYDPIMRNVSRQLDNSIGWACLDIHLGNFGRYNGDIVCIDFGNE